MQKIKFKKEPDQFYNTLKKRVEQYFEDNINMMNNFSEALKTFKTIMNFKNNCC